VYSTHDHLMADLKAAHVALLPLLAGRSIHYLDIPMHDNVGDLLIMAGTLRFFASHNLPVERIATYFNYDTDWARPCDVLALHGGGNFGDLYGPFQAFRERVIASRPDCRVVVLPQSIHFQDQANFERCREICRSHPDLHIAVRDRPSLDMASRLTRHVYLMPDMAHQLWPMSRRHEPEREVLRLRRRDVEAPPPSASSDPSVDWDDLVSAPARFLLANLVERGVTQAHLRLGLGRVIGNRLAEWWIPRASELIDRAVDLFSRYERVESDRLHAHILSCLLSMPNQIDDNSYGKNSRYVTAWTAASPLVRLRAPAHREPAQPRSFAACEEQAAAVGRRRA
jgi:pyruvyl transferase EpsO